jgi:hypothetical protein
MDKQMEKLKEQLEVLQGLTIESFDPNDIMEYIIPKGERLMDFLQWEMDENIGVIPSIDGECGAVVIKLTHPNFEDLVMVTKSFLDFANVHFLDSSFKVLHTIDNIPMDELFETIDTQLKLVTKIPIKICLN